MTPEDPTGDAVSAETRLSYDDLAGAVEFLCRAYGFRERIEDRLEDPDGNGFTATWVEVGNTTIMLGRAGDHGLVSPNSVGGSSAMIVVTVDGIDPHYRRAKSAGAEIVVDIHDVPWGFRRYESLDVGGHRWHFMQPTSR